MKCFKAINRQEASYVPMRSSLVPRSHKHQLQVSVDVIKYGRIVRQSNFYAPRNQLPALYPCSWLPTFSHDAPRNARTQAKLQMSMIETNSIPSLIAPSTVSRLRNQSYSLSTTSSSRSPVHPSGYSRYFFFSMTRLPSLLTTSRVSVTT